MRTRWVVTACLVLTSVACNDGASKTGTSGGAGSGATGSGATGSGATGSGATGSGATGGGADSAGNSGGDASTVSTGGGSTGGATTAGSGGTGGPKSSGGGGGFAGANDASCSDSEDCAASEYCSQGQCRADRCTAGETRCAGNAIEQCDAEGSGYDELETCAAGHACIASSDGATCEPWVCTPGAMECQDTRVAIECAQDGLSIVSSVDCEDTSEFCVEGECAGQLCEPNELFCIGSELHLCGDDGESSSVDTACDEGEYCDDATLACKPVEGFFEDFEDGDFDGWVLIDSTVSAVVTDTWAADGTTRSLELTGSSFLDEGLNYLFADPIRPTYVSLWGRATSSLSGGVFTLSDSETSDFSNQIVSLSFDRDFIRLFNAGFNLGGYQINSWYHIELQIDWDTKTIAYSLDGVPVDTANFVADTVESIKMLTLSTDGPTHYWDQVEVRY